MVIQITVCIVLTYAYFTLCSNPNAKMSIKISELTAMYGLNILAFTGKIKIWVLLIEITPPEL